MLKKQEKFRVRLRSKLKQESRFRLQFQFLLQNQSDTSRKNVFLEFRVSKG